MARKASVLIVDDEQFLRQILGRIVRREGYDVDEAVDGIDALSRMKDHQYDIVISDIRMPMMDGIELLKRIRATHYDTAVVLITAYAGEYVERDMIDAGADFYITKPFKNVEIAQALQSAYDRRAASAQI